MNKKVSLGFTLSLIAIACAITFIITSFFSLKNFNQKVIDVKEKAEKYSLLESLDNLVRETYYGTINEENLNYGILKGYINGLDDDYSQYLTPEEYQEIIANDSGIIVGLGLTVAEDSSGYMSVSAIMENSPIAESIIEIGDIIVSINDKDVLIDGFDACVDAMRGIAGTEIQITIRRDGVNIPLKFVLQTIELTSVSSSMLDDNIGYIKISSFKGNTPEQFLDALEYLTMNGAKALILDVRNNSGGLSTSLEQCLDPLLPEGVIANAVYSDNHTETLIYSDSYEVTIPMSALINSKTASAAELFAASLKDFGKAFLVGEQTFGKGVMQTTHAFEDGSAVILTTSEYKTVVSECFDGVGLVPDYITELSFDESDSTDYQLNKAIEVLLLEMLNE